MAATAVMAMSQIGGAISQSYMQQAQGEYAAANATWQRTQAEINARFAEMEAEDVLRRGDKEANEHQKKVRQVVGSQRAALAAQGIQVDSDTALELQRETSEIGSLDAQTIKNNAWRQAFGFKQEAISSRFAGEIAALTGQQQQSFANFQARNTLITGGISAIGTGLKYSNRPQAPSSKGGS